MKVKRLLPWVTAMALVAGAYTPPASANVDIGFSIGISSFESNLSPHGNWFVSAQYGRVWQPSVYHAGWNPYYDGHWVYTDVGWTWVSDYRWGSIPYHYGTWALDPEVGWVWVPGEVWAPSWVVFREGPGYVGWAPVPVGYSVGASFTFGNHGYYDNNYGYDYDPNVFVFVGDRDFLAPRIRERIVPVYRTRTIIQRTTVLNTVRVENNIVVNRGPSVRTIERSTGVRVQPERIERVERVAPMTRVTRDELRVDRTRTQSGPIRATAPVEQPRAQAQQSPPRFDRQPVNPPQPEEQQAPAPQRIEPRRRGEPVPEPTAEPDRRPTARNVPPPERRTQTEPRQTVPPPEPDRRMTRRNLPPPERRNQTEPSPRPIAKSKQPPPPEDERTLPPPPQPPSDPRTMAKERERQRQEAGKAKRKAPPPKKKDKDDDKDNPPS
jgi:hypothetical protein